MDRITRLDDLIVKPSWFETTIVGDVVTSMAEKAYYGGGMSLVMIGSKLAGWEKPSEEVSNVANAVVTIAEAAVHFADGAKDLLPEVLSEFVFVWFETLSAEDRRWVLKKLNLDVASILSAAIERQIHKRIKKALKAWVRRGIVNALDSVIIDIVSIGKALREHGFSRGNMAALGRILASKAEHDGAARVASSFARGAVRAAEAAAALQALTAKSIIGASHLQNRYAKTWKKVSLCPPIQVGDVLVPMDDWKYLFFFVERPMSKILGYTEAALRFQPKRFILAN
jgi:hypothetical protein